MVGTAADSGGYGLVVAAVGCGHSDWHYNTASVGAIQCLHHNQNEIRSDADHEGEGQESEVDERNTERHQSA